MSAASLPHLSAGLAHSTPSTSTQASPLTGLTSVKVRSSSTTCVRWSDQGTGPLPLLSLPHALEQILRPNIQTRWVVFEIIPLRCGRHGAGLNENVLAVITRTTAP